MPDVPLHIHVDTEAVVAAVLKSVHADIARACAQTAEGIARQLDEAWIKASEDLARSERYIDLGRTEAFKQAAAIARGYTLPGQDPATQQGKEHTQPMNDLRSEIQTTLNRHSAENGSNTPDFVLADYLLACLEAFDRTVRARESWYGRTDAPGQSATGLSAAPHTQVSCPHCGGWDTTHRLGCPQLQVTTIGTGNS